MVERTRRLDGAVLPIGGRMNLKNMKRIILKALKAEKKRLKKEKK